MLFFITLLGLLLRLSFINKPEGLWNDEYVSWFVANTSEGFWNEVLKQCHMPLYYLYLKPFAGFSDIVLRLTSVVPAIIAIPVMYIAGKEYSKKAGYYAAAITSILSFLVYYSQEVRFYSLLFLFSALSLLFTIKYLKNPSRKNLAGYIISLGLIFLTHIIGCIYIFFNLIYVMYKKGRLSKKLLWLLVPVIFIAPHFLRMLPSSQWWGHFSYTNILFLFTDYFSPILTNNVNAPSVFFYDKSLALWLVVPALIALSGMITGWKKGLGAVVLSVIAVMSAPAALGKLVFITKYSIEILPVLILFTALGFERMKKTGAFLLAVFILFHLAAFFTPNYVTKIKRNEGHRIAGEIINAQNADNVVFTYYEPDRFYRYAKLDGKKTYYISKINRFEYIYKPEKILEIIPSGETVSVVFLDSVSFFDNDFIKANESNPKIPEMFMTFSKIRNALIKDLNENFTDFRVDKLGAWTVIKAKKKNIR